MGTLSNTDYQRRVRVCVFGTPLRNSANSLTCYTYHIYMRLPLKARQITHLAFIILLCIKAVVRVECAMVSCAQLFDVLGLAGEDGDRMGHNDGQQALCENNIEAILPNLLSFLLFFSLSHSFARAWMRDIIQFASRKTRSRTK